MRVGWALSRSITEVVLICGLLGVMATPALAGIAAEGSSTVMVPSGFSPTGADISYPQCGGSLPFGQAFAVVGVNYGRDNTLNPCFQDELGWAAYQTTGDSSEPKTSVYLNTGDPGNSYLGLQITDWPASGNTPYGSCLSTQATTHYLSPGQVSPSCAYEYGYQKADQDLFWLSAAAAGDRLPTSPGDYPVWLDVETSNSWESQTELNVADLQGMVQALQKSGVEEIGVYALPLQWQEITGGANSLAFGSFPQLQDWILGADSVQTARTECQEPPFAGASVALTQFPLGQFDGDYAC